MGGARWLTIDKSIIAASKSRARSFFRNRELNCGGKDIIGRTIINRLDLPLHSRVPIGKSGTVGLGVK